MTTARRPADLPRSRACRHRPSSSIAPPRLVRAGAVALAHPVLRRPTAGAPPTSASASAPAPIAAKCRLRRRLLLRPLEHALQADRRLPLGRRLDLQLRLLRRRPLRGRRPAPLAHAFGGTFRVSGFGLTAGYRWDLRARLERGRAARRGQRAHTLRVRRRAGRRRQQDDAAAARRRRPRLCDPPSVRRRHRLRRDALQGPHDATVRFACSASPRSSRSEPDRSMTRHLTPSVRPRRRPPARRAGCISSPPCVCIALAACGGSADAPPPPGTGPVADAVPPTITQQPASVTVTAGQPASFTVAATGTAPITYQWQRNGVAIAGATVDHLHDCRRPCSATAARPSAPSPATSPAARPATTPR